MEHPKQTAESMAKNVMRFEQLKSKGIPIMFIDSMLPKHYRMNYAVIGDTASENPDYETQRAITTPHNFQIGMGWAPPGCGPAWHTHDYIESFFILKGPWRFYWGNSSDPAQPDGYFDLNEWDMISLPPGVYRGFEYIGSEIGWFFAVLESHKVYEGKDPYWSPQVERAAAEIGYRADDKGKMIHPENYAEQKSEHTARLLGMFRQYAGIDLSNFQPPK
jgi:quercetin dioxygenase-like cupin family protein